MKKTYKISGYRFGSLSRNPDFTKIVKSVSLVAAKRQGRKLFTGMILVERID